MEDLSVSEPEYQVMERRMHEQYMLSYADQSREEGNILFRKKLVSRALDCYLEAFSAYTCYYEHNDFEPRSELAVNFLKTLTNCAICHGKIKEYEECFHFCSLALDRDPSNTKARYWRVIANKELKIAILDEEIASLLACFTLTSSERQFLMSLVKETSASKKAVDQVNVKVKQKPNVETQLPPTSSVNLLSPEVKQLFQTCDGESDPNKSNISIDVNAVEAGMISDKKAQKKKLKREKEKEKKKNLIKKIEILVLNPSPS